ncbi:ABC transporter ATP-binding protein [Halomonas sp. R1t8]|uniref:ABC transporter ATP-binding protein n=1 Tax=unclassified Halomonas TaxID=2609666 RepID=UPI00209E6C94|nr:MULTISPECIES: ABC transporter ATP-binding protein [unclassified Halomonas]MCP1304603.1 ABC transporter ATP-binding protein [Halomonas sp. R1t8]MCP1330910.1 ABC transporter ATP-binding protein [Halomonas sp. R1t4]
MAEVILENIGKRYGERAVVHDLNLKMEDRGFTVLVGPSGCGKSTTLRMVAGLEEITDGRLLIDGRDVTHAPPQARDIAMVFQSYALYPHMTAYRNMAFGLQRNTRLSRAQIDSRVRDAAAMLGIAALLERKPQELSGGERQRVAIGRALVRQPKVYLFDEPLSNLDAKLRSKMRWELKRLHRELGITVLYVTHDQVEAVTLADQVVVMEGGRLQQAASPHDVYRRPANTFVASFIGAPEMNLLKGRASLRGAGLLIEGEGYELSLPEGEAFGATDVLLGLRPEEISLAPPDAAATAIGEVGHVERVGADALVEVRLSCGSVMLRAPVDGVPQAGAQVGLRFDATRARLFDAASGHAIWAA